MTTKDEALKLALEALKELRMLGMNAQWHDSWLAKPNEAITAIREALAERCVCGEPDTPGTHRTDGPCLAEQPAQKQEPVAYMGTDIDGNPNKFRLNPFGGCVPLYKKPQSVKVWDAEGYDALCQQLEGWKAKASKPWAGLTDEDLVGCDDEELKQALYWENKLKEKNT